MPCCTVVKDDHPGPLEHLRRAKIVRASGDQRGGRSDSPSLANRHARLDCQLVALTARRRLSVSNEVAQLAHWIAPCSEHHTGGSRLAIHTGESQINLQIAIQRAKPLGNTPTIPPGDTFDWKADCR